MRQKVENDDYAVIHSLWKLWKNVSIGILKKVFKNLRVPKIIIVNYESYDEISILSENLAFFEKKSYQSSVENNHFSKYEKLPLNCWKSRNPNMFVDFHKIFSFVCEWKKELTLGWVINVCVEWQHDFDQKFGRQKN